MLKAAALDRAHALARFGQALRVQGYGFAEPLARAVDAVRDALRAVEAYGEGKDSKALGEALHGLGTAFETAREESGLQGFAGLRNEAATLSLLFTGFALQGEAQRKRKRKRTG